MATYEALLGQLQAEAAAAAAAAQAAENQLATAAAILQAKREAEHEADRAAAAVERRAADLAGMRHRAVMLAHALRVCDALAAAAAEVEAAEHEARAVNLATQNGPLGALRELKPMFTRYTRKRAGWQEERADLAARIAAADRAH